MTARIVMPSSGARETLAVVIFSVALVTFAWVGVGNRQVDNYADHFFDWQVSSFYDLEDADQAIYNALDTATTELWWIHEEMLYFADGDITKVSWPTVDKLATEYELPPFVDDLAARQNGNVRWQRAAAYSFEGATVYFGSGGTNEGQSAYLLVMSHVHKGASYSNMAYIWIHPDANTAMPETVTRDSLIANGWREVVPYSGKTEADRLRSGG